MSEEQKAQLVGKIALLHKDLEKALRRVGATGNGVKELLESIQKDLEKDTVRYIRECNHLRNLAIHDGVLPSEAEFEIYKIKSQQVCTYLGNLPDGYYTHLFEEKIEEVSVIQDSDMGDHNLYILEEQDKAKKNKGVIENFIDEHPIISAIAGAVLFGIMVNR